MRYLIRLTAVAAVAGLCTAAWAGSIWGRGDHSSRSLFSDDKARNPGDVVTIVIEEKSKIDNTSQRKLEKKTNRSGSASGSLKLNDVLPDPWRGEVFQFPDFDAKSESENKLDGKADYTRDRSVTDRVTVTVEDVLPNGYLVVLGKRRRVVDGDMQMVQVSGIVRPSDISFSNEVNSSRVANFYVVYSATGTEKRYTTPGWLTKILNFITPF